MFNDRDISTEFIYRCLDSDKPTSELLELITSRLSKKIRKTLWNVGVLDESSAKFNFIKEDKFFSKINLRAKELINKKDSAFSLKERHAGYKYAVISPIKYKKQQVGIVICLTSKKDTGLVDKIARALAHFIKEHQLKKKLLEDAMVMNTIINSSQNTSSDKNISSLVGILAGHLKNHLNASGVRIYMKDEEGNRYYYDQNGAGQNFTSSFSGSITGEVLESRRPRMIQDVNEYENYNRVIDDVSGNSNIRAIIAVPLLVAGDAVGVFVVSGSAAREDFVGSELVWAKSVAREIASTYERLKLYKDIHKLLISSVKAFAAAIDGKDPYTHGHSRRVTIYAMLLGRALGLEEEKMENLKLSALLHDIGKISVPGYILTKEGKLTDEEWIILREHPQKGVKILEHIKEFAPLLDAIKHHHERWDGDGYPDGLSKEDIPYPARILTVVDAFDAMISSRVYRKALSEDEALKELKDCSGSQFDSDIASCFIIAYKSKFYAGKEP